MAKKNDMSKTLEKYGQMMKKFGSEVGEVAKKGEENVIIMSKLFKIQMDILGVSLQREKLYYKIGKEVADKLTKGTFEVSGLEKYKKELDKIRTEGEKKKKALSKVKSPGKKKVKKTK